MGRPVGGGVRPVVQDLTVRRQARWWVSEGCEICFVLQTHWYSICYNIIQSPFVPVFWDGWTDREEAMLWSCGRSGICTKLSNHWFSFISP